MTPILVAVAGALGAIARYVVDHVATARATSAFPSGTLVVNIGGSAAAGVLAGLVAAHGVEEGARVVIGTGFLAAFTTFSTFAVQVVRLDHPRAARYAAASVALSTSAAGLGYALAAAG